MIKSLNLDPFLPFTTTSATNNSPIPFTLQNNTQSETFQTCFHQMAQFISRLLFQFPHIIVCYPPTCQPAKTSSHNSVSKGFILLCCLQSIMSSHNIIVFLLNFHTSQVSSYRKLGKCIMALSLWECKDIPMERKAE